MIQNKIIKTTLENWKELVPFQPDKFKINDKNKLKKLCESYKNNGKLNPFTIWEHEGKKYIIDGHATQQVFRLLESEQVVIPEKFTCNWLDLKGKREVKKTILIYNSHYRDIDPIEALEWCKDLNFEEMQKEIEIPEIDNFLNYDKNGNHSEKNKEIDIESIENSLENECPKCKFRF